MDAKTLFGPTPAVGAEKTVKCTAQLTFNGSSSAPVTSADHTVTVVADGVKVSGKVLSYNPGNATTIQLKQGDTVIHETTIAKTTGSGQVTQSFSFDAVAPGTYDLVVTKAAHLTYTVKGVVVGGTDLDLTKHSNTAISTITKLCGDIDGDGWIDFSDYQELLKSTNYGKQTSAVGVNKIADLDGDTWIDFSDYQILLSSQHYGKSAISVSFAG